MSETYDLPGPESAAAEPPRPQQQPEAEPQDEPIFAVAETERAPEPLGVTVAATGNAEVDAAVERLADADALPTDAHIEVYEDVHRGLRDALAALDENRG